MPLQAIAPIAAQKPDVRGFYHARTGSVQYVVSDPQTGACAIIDPVLDYDEKSGATATVEADAILAYVSGAETQGHLDPRYPSPCGPFLCRRLSERENRRANRDRRTRRRRAAALEAASTICRALPRTVRNGIGCLPTAIRSRSVDRGTGDVLARAHAGLGHLCDRRCGLRARYAVHARQRHRPRRLSRRGRPRLWESIQAILSLPDETRLFTGHDYQPDGRAAELESTVAAQKRSNPHVAGRVPRISSACARRAMRPCRCRSSSCMRCRSTSAAEGCQSRR